MLRLIAGLETADGGSIRIDSRDLTRVLPADRDLAMMFQPPALYSHMTVMRNMAYPLKLRKVGRTVRRDKVREIAELLSIGHLLARYPDEISGGELRRVALGKALALSPNLLLLDEPLSSLDGPLRRELADQIKRIHRQQSTTTLMVTHDQQEAMSLADQLIVMNDGQLLQQGPPHDVFGRPQSIFVARFLGDPPMNFISGRIEEGVFVHAKLRIPLDGGTANQPGVMGIRPCDLQMLPADAPASHHAELIGRTKEVRVIGAMKIAEVVCDDVTLTVQLPTSHAITSGENVRLPLRDQVLHFFANDEHGRRLDVGSKSSAPTRV